jgi:hypothetical protein
LGVVVVGLAAPEPSIERGSHWFVINTELGPQTLSLVPTDLVIHSGGKAEVARASSCRWIRWGAPVLSLLDLLLLLLLELGLSEKFNLILLCLETKDFHLHHLHLETLGLLNVYTWGER